MSKRCELQKEYYKEFGNYKGDGKYSDHYVKWLEDEVLVLRLYSVSQQRELLDWLSNEPDHKIRKSDIDEILQDFKYYQSNYG
jgi:hypothetical protein